MNKKTTYSKNPKSTKMSSKCSALTALQLIKHPKKHVQPAKSQIGDSKALKFMPFHRKVVA
jgi:hypothetical protein